MATVLEQISAALSGNDASVRVDAQAGNVLSVGSLLDGLVQNAPPQVTDLQRAFGSLELPDFPLSGFVTRIADVRAAVPTDASGVLGGTLSSIGSIDTELGGALAASLGNLLNAFEKIRALADVRFSCAGAGVGAESGGGGGGNGGGGNGGGGGGTPPVVGNQTPTFVAATTQARDVVAQLPVPFNLRALLKFLHDASTFRRNEQVPAVLPLFDDLRDPINTLLTWETLTPAQLLGAFDTTLQDADVFVRTGVESTLNPLFTDLNALLAGVPVADLQNTAERITIRLGELRTAVQSGNLGGTAAAVTEINTRLDAWDVLRPTLVPILAPAPALRTRLLEVAGDLDVGMASMISILKPAGSALTRIPQIELELPELLQVWLQGLSDWLNDIANAIDLSVIEGPVSTVANTLRNVAEGLQQAIVAITINVQGVFNQVQALLDTLDPAQLQAEVEAAVQAFRTELIARITALVGPARAAVLDAVAGIDQAVDAFDPTDVIDALSDAIDALEAVLGEGDVGQAITAIHDGLEKLATELEGVSFKPTADSVIQTMDGLRAALEAIDPAQMPAPVADALKSAASVLPADLEPITDPILDTFGDIVDSGPTPVLEAVRDAPRQLIEAVRSFDPESLIGDDLAGPFQEVLRQMEDFRPSELLKPVEDGLDDFKEQLQRAASPGQIAQLLETPFQELKSAINNFDPNALVDPLDEALSTVTQKLLDILPVDETFAIMDTGLGAVQRVLDTMDDLVGLVRGLREAAVALVDVRGQMQAWVNEVLAKIDGIADTSSLTPRLTALRTALDATRANAIATRFTTGGATARTALNTVNGTTRLSALIQAHRGVSRTELQALPASAQKTAIQNVLDRFDPLLPEFGAPWHQLGELRQALLDGEAELQTLLTVWDDRFHATGGSLDELKQTQATPAQLRAWAQEAFETQLVEPVARLLFFLEPVRNLFDAFLLPFEELVTTVQSKLAAILTGPESLTAIRESLGQITNIIGDLDLEFLRTSLNDLFLGIRNKLDEVSPAQLGTALDASFAAILDTITIDLILPPADVQAIDDAYAGIVERLRLLDPSTLVTDVVKPLFEEKVVPLLDKFDIAPSLEIIVDKLGGMDDELREEIARVNEAYKKLLGALPDGTNPSASVSVSVAA